VEKRKLDRYPLNGTFELTAKCNLKCRMCLFRIDNERMAELGGKERTTDEWIHLAQEVQEAGTIGLLLTGGEPMLRSDFIPIYKAIAQMGFILTIYTNATLVTTEIMEMLRKYPPHRIGVTVYGASPETYEKVTGNANAYDRMIEGVERLRQLPSKLTIRTTLIKDNLEDLNEITRWAHKFGKNVEFNVTRIVTKPVRGGVANVEECRLTPEQNVTMIKERNINFIIKPFNKFITENPEMITESKNLDWNSSGEEHYELDKKPTLYGCEAGMSSYTIAWDGKLIGCQMLGDCWTYPFEDGFQKAWEDFPRQVKLPPIPDQCIGCDVNCSACPATRLAETGFLGGLPEYLCRESKLTNEMQRELVTELQKSVYEKG